MVAGSSKRIVVIRDIPSNFIEEAILILKAEPGNTTDEGTKDTPKKNRKVDDDFILKEAELVINNYIKEHKARGLYADETVKRRLFKPKLPVPALITSGVVAGIALLVFLLTRFL